MPKYTEAQLAEFAGKRVTVTQNLSEPNEKGESAVEIEGVVEIGNALGLLIKPKGAVQLKMIGVDEIEEIVPAKEKSQALKRAELQPVKLGQARRHLMERHGVTLKWVNENTEEAAFEYHESLDHEQLDLGHVHKEKASGAKSDEQSDADAA